MEGIHGMSIAGIGYIAILLLTYSLFDARHSWYFTLCRKRLNRTALY